MVKTGRKLWAAHPHVRTGSDLSFGERAADGLKHWMGTWTILGIIAAVILAVWFGVNDPGHLLLNLGLSLTASVQGVVLQIAANRGDRINAEVSKGTHDNSAKLLELQEQQMQILAEIRKLTPGSRL